MKFQLKAAALVVALSVASPALAAKTLSFSGTMKSYSGNRAYAVVYLVDSDGQYVSTIYAAGSKGKYFKHLSRWKRMYARSGKGVDGSTGASLGSTQSFSSSVNIPDKLIDAGYVLRVETAVENQNYFPEDVVIPLDSAHNGAAVTGSGYVGTMKVDF